MPTFKYKPSVIISTLGDFKNFPKYEYNNLHKSLPLPYFRESNLTQIDSIECDDVLIEYLPVGVYSLSLFMRAIILAEYSILIVHGGEDENRLINLLRLLVMDYSTIRGFIVIIDLEMMNEERFKRLKMYLERLIEKNMERVLPFEIIPVSIENNLNFREKCLEFEWFKGPTLLEWLNSLKPNPKVQISQSKDEEQELKGSIVSRKGRFIHKIIVKLDRVREDLQFEKYNGYLSKKLEFKLFSKLECEVRASIYNYRISGQLICLSLEASSTMNEYLRGNVIGNYVPKGYPLWINNFWVDFTNFHSDNSYFWNVGSNIKVYCGLNESVCEILKIKICTEKHGNQILRVQLKPTLEFPRNITPYSRHFLNSFQQFQAVPYHKDPTFGLCMVKTRKNCLRAIGKVTKVNYSANGYEYCESSEPLFKDGSISKLSDITFHFEP